MRNLLLASVAVLSLGVAAAPALADSVGASAGAATGATAGFFIAGPVGAVVGGVLGAGVGSGVSDDAVTYARAHHEESVSYDGDIRPGYRVGHGLHMYAVPNDEKYSYVYVNDRPVLVDNGTNTVVWVGD